jgi:hypothetical protein
MRRCVLLPSIGCLGASGLTLLSCSLFGLGFGAVTEEPKTSAAPRAVRATLSSRRTAQPSKTVTPKVGRPTRGRVEGRHTQPQAVLSGVSHVAAGGDDEQPGLLPPTKPAPPAPTIAVAPPFAPSAAPAPVLDALPLRMALPIAVPVPVPDVTAVVEVSLP